MAVLIGFGYNFNFAVETDLVQYLYTNIVLNVIPSSLCALLMLHTVKRRCWSVL